VCRIQPFLLFSRRESDNGWKQLIKWKYQARLTSVPRVLTIAVEREPKGDDDISVPRSFAVGGGLYRLVACTLWHRDLERYGSVVFDPDADE
jgi:hypothetical protein